MPSIKIWKDELEDDALPRLCMKCGAPATHFVKKSFRWYPPWINILILAGLLIWAILASILAKTASIRAPFCDEHEGHWRIRSRICWIPLLGTLLVLIIGITISVIAEGNRNLMDLGGIVAAVGGGSFVLWLLVSAFVQQTGIRPTEITDDSATFKQVNEDFIAALRDDREAEEEEADRRYRERKSRRRERRHDEDDDD